MAWLLSPGQPIDMVITGDRAGINIQPALRVRCHHHAGVNEGTEVEHVSMAVKEVVFCSDQLSAVHCHELADFQINATFSESGFDWNMHQAMRFNRTNLRAGRDRIIQFAHIVVVAHVFADHALKP